MTITYYKCVPVALATQQAKHMSDILSSVACLSVLCFSTLADKQHGIPSKIYVCSISSSRKNSVSYYQ
jgi:hypothetical protein